MVYYLGESPPEWGPLAVALAARAVEERLSETVIMPPKGISGPVLQDSRLLGTEWECEYYIDVGAKGARSYKGGVEGFILKAAVLERCDRNGRLEERVKHTVIRPPGRDAAVPFLPVVGGERLRQAAVYLVELGLAINLARAGGGRNLVVRHGALLQQIASYFNDIYDVECPVLRVLLGFAGLEKSEALEVVEYSQVRDGLGASKCNVGLAVLILLQKLKRAAGDSDIIALAEDVSRTRYLTLYTLSRLVRAYSQGDSVTMGLLLGAPIDEASGCLSGLGVDVQEARYTLTRSLEDLIASTLESNPKDPVLTLRRAARAGEEQVVEFLYRGQLLDRLGVRSDVEPLMVYRFLYGPRDAPMTTPKEKSRLVGPPARKSFRSNGLEKRALSGVGEEDVASTVRGFMFSYLIIDPTPTCEELGELSNEASRGSLSARDLADMVKVRHPLKLEYMEASAGRLELIVQHVYTQATATLYGVPPQLLVVDRRSRVTEWDAAALREVLEAMGRRVVPYSTFIRDFATRKLYST